ncbi:MAG: AAA family ATPase [Cyanobacteria bacterium J06638_20]
MSVVSIPWHFLLYRIDEREVGKASSLLRWHLAFWDEWQVLPIWGLDKHLLLVLERSPQEGQAALNYLSISRQRWAAQVAQIELDARQIERCADAVAIAQIHHQLTIGDLEGSADPIFRTFTRISADVDAAINQSSAYNQRLALITVGDRLDGLLRELTRSSDKYAVRFRPIAQRWGNIIALELDELTQAAELRQEIDSPYIIGVPLTQQQEIFVGRTDISTRIEQLLLDRRRPPLLLYGQRRTGKTSLLNNLGRLLPQSIVPLFVDLQGPASNASNHSGFLYNLARGMGDSAKAQRNLTLPPLSRDSLADDPFTRFDEWLDEVEAALQDATALLALDEFEVLDQVLVDGRFSESAVLGMLRNLIQHRPRFKVMLSGSHTLQEFQRWSSYLINAQVLHLGYLKEPETRQLTEHPVKDFALRYEPDASQRVLDLTRGHPFLVQLLCAEIVALKNEQDPSIRRLATLADVEAAIPEALSSGSMFFSDIEGNQVDSGALAVLRYIAAHGESATVGETALENQFSDGWRGAIGLLVKRELLERVPSGYKFQVELIRQWFAQ